MTKEKEFTNEETFEVDITSKEKPLNEKTKELFEEVNYKKVRYLLELVLNAQAKAVDRMKEDIKDSPLNEDSKNVVNLFIKKRLGI